MPDPPVPFRSASRPRRLVRRVAWATLLTASVLGAAACGSSSDDDQGRSTPAASDAGPLSTKDLVRLVQRSTVSIVAQPPGERRAPSAHGAHAHGSGVIWDARRGLVLTSDHLVENASAIDVTVGGRPVHGELIARAQCNDLAVLQLHPNPSAPAIRVRDSDDLQIGDVVTAVGYLKPATATKPSLIKLRGDVAAVGVSAKVARRLPDFPSVVVHEIATQPYGQMSGGPLVDDHGRLVGLTTVLPPGESEPVNVAVSSDFLKQRMSPGSATGLRFENGNWHGWEDQHACHQQMAKIAGRVLVRHGAPDAAHEHGGH
jgi:S1-C subfamily serine protease